jgi:N-acetylmuramoyl-L-alanine amidase
VKFGIDMGHNAPPDTGASGWAKEDDLTKAVGTRVRAKLAALGHIAVNCNPSSAYSVLDSLNKRVSIANAQNVDLYVSIHFNAFNGKANGAEVFAVSSSGERYAKPVLREIVRLGFYNRGVKDGSHLYVLKNTWMPAILIECCFIDSWRDRDLYDTERMANAIVTGLTGQSPVVTPPPNTEENTGGSTPPTSFDAQVLKLQQQLNQLQIRDHNNKPLSEDGLIGPATRFATQRFNDLMAITSGDTASAATWKAIAEILARPILRPSHATGKAVRYVQFRIGTAIDGIFGSQTATAVRRFQLQTHITVDGIVGPQCWGKLLV